MHYQSQDSLHNCNWQVEMLEIEMLINIENSIKETLMVEVLEIEH